MENWGLITYQEKCLLYNSKFHNQERKQDIAATIAHEIAHQWVRNKKKQKRVLFSL